MDDRSPSDLANMEASDGRDAAAVETGQNTGSFLASSVVVTGAGNILVAGSLEGSVDLGMGSLQSAGRRDIALAMFDSSGTLVWQRRYGDAADQAGALLGSDDTGNIFVATGFSGTLVLGGEPLVSVGGSDMAVAKLDGAGTTLWSKRFGDAADQYPTAVSVDSTGAVTLAMHFGTGLPNEGTSVIRLTASGDTLWTKEWPLVEASAMAATPAGDCIVTGWFRQSIDFGGGGLTSAGLEDVFIVQFDAAGTWSWNRRFGSERSERASGLAIHPDGDLVITGTFNGRIDFGTGDALVSPQDPSLFTPSFDMFLARLDTTGAGIWSRRFGDAATDQQGVDVAVNASGSILVTGDGGALIDFGLGGLIGQPVAGFVVEFDGLAQPVWNASLPSSGVAVRGLPSGATLVGGAFPSGDFPDATRVFRGGSAVFLVETTDSGS